MHNPSNRDKDAMRVSNFGGIGARSYAQRMFGNQFSVDLQQVNPGHFRATVSAQGNSLANRVFGDHLQVDGQRVGARHYRGVVSTRPARAGVGQRLRASTAKRGTLMAVMRPRGRLSASPGGLRPTVADMCVDGSRPQWKNGHWWCKDKETGGWICAEEGGHCG